MQSRKGICILFNYLKIQRQYYLAYCSHCTKYFTYSHLAHSYLWPPVAPTSLSVCSHSLWLLSSLTSVSRRGLRNPWQQCHESPQCGISSSTSTCPLTCQRAVSEDHFSSPILRDYIQNHVSEATWNKWLPSLAPTLVSFLISLTVLPLSSSVLASLMLAPPTQNFNLSVSHKACDWLSEVYIITRVT